jgi:hypothetical protein
VQDGVCVDSERRRKYTAFISRMLPIGGPHPMVPVAVAGDAAFYRVAQETTVVERCLQALQNIRCCVPDFLYFKIKKLKMGESTVVHTVERICKADQDVV